jgi:hypothetical protein
MKQLRLLTGLIAILFTGFELSAQTYCSSGASSSIDTYIEFVSFHTISATNTSCATYTDNTSMVASVYKGQTYTLTVRSGDCNGGGAYTHELRAYIDWNNDGDFTDAGEEVLTKSPRSAASTETRQVTIPFSAATAVTRMRVVATEGTAQSCGSYSWGETEDYSLDISSQGRYDADMRGVTADAAGLNGYTQIPFVQAPVFSFESTVRNSGFDTITGVTMNASISGTAYSQAIGVGTMLPAEDTTVNGWNPYVPTAQGAYEFQVVATINETDTLPFNDTTSVVFTVSDTVLARDDSSVTGGLGFNPPYTGEFGHVIDVVSSDTLTSTSFYLSSPAVGTTLRAYVYKSDTAKTSSTSYLYDVNSGLYWNRIDSSRSFTVSTGTGAWYTLLLGCEEGVAVDPGKYMIGVYQLNPNNMSFGYTYSQPTDTGITFYRNAQTDTVWVDLKTSPSTVSNATYMIRANFGVKAVRNLFADTAYYCNGGNVTLKPSGSWDSFTWDNQTRRDSLVVNSQGVYGLMVEDELGCQYMDSVRVLERDPITVNATVSVATCGNSDGMAIAMASGSNAPFTYMWDNGTMDDTVSGIPGGTYMVTATDAVGCTEDASFLVLGKNPVLAGTYTPPTCNGDADGVAQVNVTEGIPSYTYAWQTGGSTSDQLSGLSSGTYTVTVTDSSNCSSSITVSVVDPDSLLLSTSNSTNPSTCGANDGEARVDVTGGVAPYSYFWSNNQNQKRAINLATGTFDVTVTDALGCVRTSTVTLVDPNTPTVAGVGSSVTCSHDLGNVAVTVSGGTPPYNYFWNNNSTDSSQTGLAVGSYNVNVTDSEGCLTEATVDVSGPDHMDVDFQITYGPAGDGDTDVDAVITGANNPYNSYQWKTFNGIFSNDISGATTTTLNDAVNGNYRLVVEDAQGCLDSAEVSVNNISVGINMNVLSENGMMVYPNPTNGKVNIKLEDVSGDLHVKVLDAQGRIIAETNVDSYTGSVIEMNLSNQADGIYFIEVNSSSDRMIQKIHLNR